MWQNRSMHAYDRIASPKRMIIYPDFAHEGLPDMNDSIFDFMVGL